MDGLHKGLTRVSLSLSLFFCLSLSIIRSEGWGHKTVLEIRPRDSPLFPPSACLIGGVGSWHVRHVLLERGGRLYKLRTAALGLSCPAWANVCDITTDPMSLSLRNVFMFVYTALPRPLKRPCGTSPSDVGWFAWHHRENNIFSDCVKKL